MSEASLRRHLGRTQSLKHSVLTTVFDGSVSAIVFEPSVTTTVFACDRDKYTYCKREYEYVETDIGKGA